MRIVNSCVMPKDGVSASDTTTMQDVKMVGLTPGVKYHAAFTFTVSNKLQDVIGFRPIINDANNRQSESGRYGLVFTANAETMLLTVNIDKCTVKVTDGLCVPESQWPLLTSLGLPDDYFTGDTMPIS